MKFTNWDRFKDDKSICNKLGCNEEAKYVCCPDLDSSLCKPKQKWLKGNDIKEEDLDANLINHKQYFE